MIKANELRIGNWLQYSKFNIKGRVNLIADNTIQLHNQYEEWTPNIEDINPIPLTPEILEGILEANIITIGCYKIGEKIVVQNNSLGEYAIFINGEKTSSLEYKYLHELQNLNTDLKQEELTVNINVATTI